MRKAIGSRNNASGLLAEDIAVNYMLDLGFVLIARRWKSTFGEIDLIFIDLRDNLNKSVKGNNVDIDIKQDKDFFNSIISLLLEDRIYQFIFVEVKKKNILYNGNSDIQIDSILRRKQAIRIQNSIQEFLGHFPNYNTQVRFDVILIEQPEISIHHFQNIYLNDLL